jgi:hypothetical protein
MPFVAAICAAAPSASAAFIAWNFVDGATSDLTWKLRVAYGVFLPLAVGFCAMVFGSVSMDRGPDNRV